MLELVKLKNGTEEAKSLVTFTLKLLNNISESKAIVLYELVMKCRDRNHQFFGNTADTLRAYALLQSDNSVHTSIRNIVLSSAEGDGLDMKFVNPIIGDKT